jgi:4-hydroxy-tetrahydrodipicolinate synthase
MPKNVTIFFNGDGGKMSYKIISPTVTIIDENGKIDLDANKKVIEFLLMNNIGGFAPFGSTGEFTEFSNDEKLELIKLYVEVVGGKVPVIAGTGNINLKNTLDLSKKALDAGVDGLLILPPFYYAMGQEEAYNWYARLAEELDGDIYIYNFPARTGLNIAPETIEKLVRKYPNIAGIKDTVDNAENTKAIIYRIKKIKPDFKVYSGFDNQFVSNILSGGDGNISAFSNIVPEIWASWIKAAEEKDFNKVKRIQQMIDSLMPLYKIRPNFSKLFKILMNKRGFNISTKSIFPFDEISEKEVELATKIFSSVIDWE